METELFTERLVVNIKLQEFSWGQRGQISTDATVYTQKENRHHSLHGFTPKLHTCTRNYECMQTSVDTYAKTHVNGSIGVWSLIFA